MSLQTKGIPLPSRERTSSEHHCLSFTISFFQCFVDKLVVDHRVHIVHRKRAVRLLMVLDVQVRYAFAKIGLLKLTKSGHWPSHKRCERTLNASTPRSIRSTSLDLYHARAPGLVISTTASPGCHKSHLDKYFSHLGAKLPKEDPLPNVAICALYKVPLINSFPEQARFL